MNAQNEIPIPEGISEERAKIVRNRALDHSAYRWTKSFDADWTEEECNYYCAVKKQADAKEWGT